MGEATLCNKDYMVVRNSHFPRGVHSSDVFNTIYIIITMHQIASDRLFCQ